MVEFIVVFLWCSSVVVGLLDLFGIMVVFVMVGCLVVNVVGIFCFFFVVICLVKFDIEDDVMLVDFRDDGFVLSCFRDK